MKPRVGYKWKAVDGLHKGQWFIITAVSPTSVDCKRLGGEQIYNYSRKFFEDYITRVERHWAERNKSYKAKKQRLRND